MYIDDKIIQRLLIGLGIIFIILAITVILLSLHEQKEGDKECQQLGYEKYIFAYGGCEKTVGNYVYRVRINKDGRIIKEGSP